MSDYPWRDLTPNFWSYYVEVIEKGILIEREVQAVGVEVSPTAIAEAVADEIAGFVYNAPKARTALGLDSEE